MKMKRVLFGLLILVSTIGYSQKNQIQVQINEKEFGKSLIDNSVITGIEYVFPERINDAFLDTTTNFLTVQLRGVSKNGKWLNNRGNIVQYDIKNQKVLWSKKIAYQTSSLLQFNKTMIYTSGNKSSCLDIHTGNEIWKAKNAIMFVNPANNIGIGYKFKTASDYSNTLEGIDLTNGNILWGRNLNREYGWNNLFYINDSTMVVVAAGLHSINIKTGRGWNYNTITGKKDYSATDVSNAIGFVAGLLTGIFIMSSGYNLVRDLVSNTIVDNDSIYFASAEQLVKLNKQSGEIYWRYPFQQNILSKSSIFVKDSILFMVNKGIAFMGQRQLNYGKPFFAAFNKNTSEQIFLSFIDVKNDPILTFAIHNDEIILIFKNRIAKYSMETGTEILVKEFPKNDFGELRYFVGNQVFITSQDGELLNLCNSDSTKMYVFTNEGKTLSIDENLDVTNTFEYNDLSINYLHTKDLNFIAKDTNTVIVDDEGKNIATIEATSNSIIVNGILYDTQDKKFTQIDLNEIMTNK